jgi:DNA mismatch endonuclease (patch repair protein)
MADIVDVVTRSRMMSAIRSKNTTPELVVRRALHAQGFRFRIHERKLPGTPDLVLPRHRAAVFVSGCFWHGHDCSLFRLPKTRPEFWQKKIEANQTRDASVVRKLSVSGWRHATVWECALRGRQPSEIAMVISDLASWIRSDRRDISLRGRQ